MKDAIVRKAATRGLSVGHGIRKQFDWTSLNVRAEPKRSEQESETHHWRSTAEQE